MDDALFYLGKLIDPESGQPDSKRLQDDPAHFTTHAVITGMTGSGKTGLLITLLEEAALQGIPALIIDPKGDLTNLLLHFPELNGEDFAPWVDPDLARRKNITELQAGSEEATRWKVGLAAWELGSPELTKLNEKICFNVYTPGSAAGLPVNVLSSFARPDLAWEENREVLREKITSTVTALLSLVGLKDIDPLRSREHILLANLLERAWSQGVSIDLSDLILQVQNPPMEKLGAFPVASFFPERDRASLAMLLNNFLAAPSFETWREGQPLDVASLLFTGEGKPRHSIFYLAHLGENERMFFITMLLAALESWMYTQRGTGSLRALLAFDEIHGYLPPVMNPPSRPPLLRLLRQGRAFGLGLVLATQNPVDLDYKALTNAGTWVIGRLQTEQDKERLLDGLQSAGSPLDRRAYDRLLSRLGKRTFLYHSVHCAEPQVFQSRWTLNYLAGPLTRTQIAALNRLNREQEAPREEPVAEAIQEITPQEEELPLTAAVVTQRASEPEPVRVRSEPSVMSNIRQEPPEGIAEYFLPVGEELRPAAAAQGIDIPLQMPAVTLLYHPGLLSQADVHIRSQRYGVDILQKACALMENLPDGPIPWEQYNLPAFTVDELATDALPNSHFSNLPVWLADPRRLKTLEEDFIDWVYRTLTVSVRVNEALNIVAGPDVSNGEYYEKCSRAARQALEDEQQRLSDVYQKKLSSIDQKMARKELQLHALEQEVEQRRLEELSAGGELLLSVFNKRKRSVSASLSKRRLASQAKADAEKTQQEFELMAHDRQAMEQDWQQELDRLREHWGQVVNQFTDTPLTPARKDIGMTMFGVIWRPYYALTLSDHPLEIPAFGKR